MTCIGSEIETLTSEDFGFKKLGQATILPSYNEKLPFASLQNLDISNYGSLYAACSGKKIVVGKLQQLRENIQNDANTEISFIWEKEVDDVMAVKLVQDEKLVYVNKQSQVFQLDLVELGEPTEIFKFDRELVHVKFWRNSILLTLDSSGQLRTLCLIQKQPDSLLDSVAAFDLFQDQLYVFDKSFSIQIYQLESWNHVSKKTEFNVPSELLDEIREEYHPVSISALSSQEYQLVFGIPVTEEEEDVSYDHRIFVVKEIGGQMTFQESFDMTPAFGSVIRYPIYYNERLSPLINDISQINILTSSCSSEITIWDSEKVIQPLQDSERAVLPISKVTDNDTNPVGVALDVVTEGAIAQPCPGVDTVDKLPMIYILNNEGSLQIVGFYHATAIKEGKFDVEALKESVVGQEMQEEVPFETSNIKEKPKMQEDSLESLGGLSLGTEKNQTESKPVSGGLEKKDSDNQTSGASNGSTFGKSTFGQTSFGQPAFGQSSFGQSSFGQPSFGKPAFGQPSFGQPSFGQPAFGQPAFGSSNQSTSSVFGKPSFGASTESSAPAFGKPSFGSSAGSSGPVFGQAAFGKTGFGTSTGKEPALEKSPESAFGKPMFGQSSFGSTTNESVSGSAAFGKPSFGSNNNTGFGGFNFPKEKSPFEASTLNTSGSSFGSFAKGQTSRGSPFASLAKKENIDNKPSLDKEKKEEDPLNKTKSETADPSNVESSNISSPPNELKSPSSGPSTGGSTKTVTTPEKPTFAQSTMGSISSNKKQSPFAAFAKDENLPVFTSPSYGASKTRPFFSQSSTVPSSPSKQRFEPLSEKEDKKRAAENVGEDRKSEKPSQEKDSSDKKNLLGTADELSDSTVEQTPVRPASKESSISSLTAKIKESATFSSNDLKSPSTSQQSRTSKEGHSPFAQYTGDLNKPSSTGFTFSQVPNLNKEKDFTKDSQFKPQGTDKKLESQESESSEGESSEGKKELSEEVTNASRDTIDSHLDRKVGSSAIGDNQTKSPEDRKEDKKTNSNSPTALSGTSREDSYDTLNDITRGELENAGVNADVATQHHKAQQKETQPNERIDSEKPGENSTQSVQIQTSPSISVSTGTQVEKTISGDADCQTNPAEVTDFKLQTFEDDNAYLSEQYKPKPIPEYFSGANVTDIKYSSQDPILKSIEKTYHYVSAELSVLLENISGLDKFFENQCLKHPIQLDENSIANMYQWRIPDASKLYKIWDNKNRILNELFARVDSTKGKAFELTEESVKPLQSKLVSVREEYAKLEKLNHEFQKGLGELRYHQLDKQSELRGKMFKTSETIQHIEELLQILKLYTIQGKQMGGNSYVVKLAREAADRENLLHEIARLREDIKDLNLKDERAIEPKEPSIYAMKNIQSIEVVQVGLRLNTKKQLGEMLKKRNNIETYL